MREHLKIKLFFKGGDMRYFAVVLTLMLFIIGCGPAVNVNQSSTHKYFYYAGSDDELAAEKLANFLRNNGFEVIKKKENIVAIAYDDWKVILIPKMLASPNKIDRIVVMMVFSIKEKYKGREILLFKVNELNENYNTAQFSLDSERDSVLVLGYVTFVDKISLIELRNFLNWFVPAVTDELENKMKKYLK